MQINLNAHFHVDDKNYPEYPNAFCYIIAWYTYMVKHTIALNPLNATGANMHQILMLTENYGIERVT